jgi:ATP-dependent RNA helicase DeaD
MLLNSAKVSAEWMDPPSPETIRAQDQERLLADPALTEEPGEEDLAMARALLAGRDAETIAAAFVRAYRARLPEPEELFDPGFARNLPGPKPERGERPGRREREERAPRPDDEPMAWFRINIGRQGNADPRWLIPLLCRRGHVTKKDIGTIRIMDRETKFGIAERVAPRFATAVRRSNDQRDDTDADLKIEPMDGQGSFAPTTKRERGPSEARGADRKPGGPERKHAASDGKPGGPERKPDGKKPFKSKGGFKDKDGKGSGRALAGKWEGRKKGPAPR